jgi:hypothetical protein
MDSLSAKLSATMFADNIQKPTREELEEARHHAEHEHELQAGLDHPASGHEFDDHALRTADDVPLRGGHGGGGDEVGSGVSAGGGSGGSGSMGPSSPSGAGGPYDDADDQPGGR